jgi:hypothetical protein
MSYASIINSPTPVYSVSDLSAGEDMARNVTDGTIGIINAIQTSTYSGPLYVTLPAGTYFLNMYALIGTQVVNAVCPYAQLFVINSTGTVYAQSSGIVALTEGYPVTGANTNFGSINETVRISLSTSTQLTMQLHYAQCSGLFECINGKLTAYPTV